MHSGGDLYVIPDDRISDDPERYNVTALHEHRRPVAPKPKASGRLVTVHIRSIARDGRPGLGMASFLNVKDETRGIAYRPLPGDPNQECTDARWDGADCIQLPPGTYSVTGLIKTMPSWASSTGSGKPLNFSLVGYPEIEITKDTEIVLDARKATEVTVETPEHTTKPNLGAISHLMWTRGLENGQSVDEGVDMADGSTLEQRVFMQPTEKVRTGTFEVYTRWRLEAPAITMRTRGRSLNPEYYPAAYFSDTSDQFPRLDGTATLPVADGDQPGADLRGRLGLIRRKDGLPVAEQSNRAAKAGARMVAIYNDKPGVNDDPGGYGVQLQVPTVRRSHEEGRALLSRKNAKVTAVGVVDSPYQYELVFPETGQISKNLHWGTHSWFKAPITGGLHALNPFTRTGDLIRLHVGLVDAAGNFSNAYTSMFPNGFATDFRVYRDDQLVAQTHYLPRGTLFTTPKDAAYRVEYDYANTAPWARSSTSTKTVWTFRSAHTTESTVIPVLQVGLDADLDLRNRVRSGKLKLGVSHMDGSSAPLKRLSLETSFDDGATWTSVPVEDGAARLNGKGWVSLRVIAEDKAGSTVKHEVIRAYELH